MSDIKWANERASALIRAAGVSGEAGSHMYSSIVDALKEAARAGIADALVLLRKIEWSGGEDTCPSCGHFTDDGHRGDCELNGFLVWQGSAARWW